MHIKNVTLAFLRAEFFRWPKHGLSLGSLMLNPALQITARHTPWSVVTYPARPTR